MTRAAAVGRLLPLLLGLAAGCDGPDKARSEDAALLDDPPTQSDIVVDGALLPLTKGNRWVMATETDHPGPSETIVVGDRVRVGAHEGTEVTTLRAGKPWRREVYRSDATGLYLLGIADERAPLMALTPPLPIASLPLTPGKYATWRGTLMIRGKAVPADAFSRVTGLESVQTARQGRFQAWKIDTVLMVRPAGQAPIPFPNVRWLSPSVGFVQRAYADRGVACRSQLTHMDLRGAR